MKEIIAKNIGLDDLSVILCGKEQCMSGYNYGPALREYYILHYILSGKGIFEKDNQSYNLSTNDGFLICPGEITYYEADKDFPWAYIWIGFKGKKAKEFLTMAGIGANTCTFSFNDVHLKSLFNRMVVSRDVVYGKELYLTGLLYELFSLMVKLNPDPLVLSSKKVKSNHIEQSIWYIEQNFSRYITVQDIAEHIGLDRSYLNTIFKKETGKNLKRYLIEYRIEKACQYLSGTDYQISSISYSVGYKDPLLFSRMFKKLMHLSPSDYRIKTRHR